MTLPLLAVAEREVQGGGRVSLTAKLARYFAARPNQWINAKELLHIAGFAAWRTRLSELRRPPYNMVIENSVERIDCDGDMLTLTRYRYVPREQEEAA